MVYKDFCIQPECDLDEKFIESEISFLIDVSIKRQNEFKDTTAYAAAVKQHYDLWLENYGRS